MEATSATTANSGFDLLPFLASFDVGFVLELQFLYGVIRLVFPH